MTERIKCVTLKLKEGKIKCEGRSQSKRMEKKKTFQI